jgi:hypothetical protein
VPPYIWAIVAVYGCVCCTLASAVLTADWQSMSVLKAVRGVGRGGSGKMTYLKSL